MQAAEGKLYLFVGIDRTSRLAVTQLVDKADRRTAWEFLAHLLEAVPCQVHTILTDNGIQFAKQPRNRNTIYSRRMHFDMICEANGIEHRLADFMAADNFARTLKTPSGPTPYEYICKIWTSGHDGFILNPIHRMTGLNT